VATQSPSVLDRFEPNEVLVAEWVDGQTQVRRLDGEALNTWLQDYTLSDLYDSNLLGGRP
jgi:hypothetical protein